MNQFALKFNQFILESKTDQLTDTKSTKILVDLYEKFNKEYFNNQLVKDFEIKWVRSKNKGGVVLATVISTGSGFRKKYIVKNIQSLSISNYRPLTQDKLNGIMLHEMIHVYLFQNGIVETSGLSRTHGDEFLAKLKELQSKVDFKIPLTEESMEISDHIESKKFDVLFFIEGGKNYTYELYKENFLVENEAELKNKYDYYLKNKRKTTTIEAVVIQSNYRDLLNYKCKRLLKGYSVFKTDENFYNNVLENGEIMYKF